MDKQISLAVIVVCCFFIARCIWLWAIRMKYLERAANRVQQRSGLNTNQRKELADEYYAAIWGIIRMLLSFWVWRLDKMVRSRIRFEEVMTSEQ